MLKWGDDWAPGADGPPTLLVHETCGEAIHPVLTCPRSGGGVTTANTHSEPGSGRQPGDRPAPSTPVST